MNSALIKSVLEQGDFGMWQTAALVLFVGLMIGVSLWIFWPGSKSYYDRIASEVVKGDSKA